MLRPLPLEIHVPLEPGCRVGCGSWGGLWYDNKISEQMINQAWTNLMDVLCSRWNVFAADLKNEPVDATWGFCDDPHRDARRCNEKLEWGHAAGRIGNHILEQCPRMLIVVEGVGGGENVSAS